MPILYGWFLTGVLVPVATTLITLLITFLGSYYFVRRSEWFKKMETWKPLGQQFHSKRLDLYPELIQHVVHTTNVCRRLTWNFNQEDKHRRGELISSRDALVAMRGKNLLLMKKPLLDKVSEFITFTHKIQKMIPQENAIEHIKEELREELTNWLWEIIRLAKEELKLDLIDAEHTKGLERSLNSTSHESV